MTDTDKIHRTPALDKMGLARCREDNKLFSWRKGGVTPIGCPPPRRRRPSHGGSPAVNPSMRSRSWAATVPSPQRGTHPSEKPTKP